MPPNLYSRIKDSGVYSRLFPDCPKVEHLHSSVVDLLTRNNLTQ